MGLTWIGSPGDQSEGAYTSSDDAQLEWVRVKNAAFRGGRTSSEARLLLALGPAGLARDTIVRPWSGPGGRRVLDSDPHCTDSTEGGNCKGCRIRWARKEVLTCVARVWLNA